MKQENKQKDDNMAFRIIFIFTLTFLVSVSAVQNGLAQTPTPTPPWIYNGTNIVNTNTGNVGIGTNTPASRLDIRKDASGGLGPILTLTNALGGMNAGGAIDFSNSALMITQQARIQSLDNNDWSANLAFFTKLPGASNNPLIERFRITSSGYVGIGTTNPQKALDVNGDINVSGNINAKYQDVAEWVPCTQKLAAGTVVILDTGKTNHVLASNGSYDTSVAGVVSESPGIILGEGGDNKLKIATTGRVKVKVDATKTPIKVGDLLVTSNIEGLAMKSIPVDLGGTSIHRPGTIIGKALEPLAGGAGEILVLLTLQ